MRKRRWYEFRRELEQALSTKDFQRLLKSYPFATEQDPIYEWLPETIRIPIIVIEEAKKRFLAIPAGQVYSPEEVIVVS